VTLLLDHYVSSVHNAVAPGAESKPAPSKRASCHVRNRPPISTPNEEQVADFHTEQKSAYYDSFHLFFTPLPFDRRKTKQQVTVPQVWNMTAADAITIKSTSAQEAIPTLENATHTNESG
jgi:hypothetical protein